MVESLRDKLMALEGWQCGSCFAVYLAQERDFAHMDQVNTSVGQHHCFECDHSDGCRFRKSVWHSLGGSAFHCRQGGLNRLQRVPVAIDAMFVLPSA